MGSEFFVRVVISMCAVAVIGGTVLFANTYLPTDEAIQEALIREEMNKEAVVGFFQGVKNIAYVALIIAAISFAMIVVLVHQLNQVTSSLKKIVDRQ